jgi:hypothetical protein
VRALASCCFESRSATACIFQSCQQPITAVASRHLSILKSVTDNCLSDCSYFDPLESRQHRLFGGDLEGFGRVCAIPSTLYGQTFVRGFVELLIRSSFLPGHGEGIFASARDVEHPPTPCRLADFRAGRRYSHDRCRRTCSHRSGGGDSQHTRPRTHKRGTRRVVGKTRTTALLRLVRGFFYAYIRH